MGANLWVPGVGFAWFRCGNLFAIKKPVEPIHIVTYRHRKDDGLGTSSRGLKGLVAMHGIVFTVKRDLQQWGRPLEDGFRFTSFCKRRKEHYGITVCQPPSGIARPENARLRRHTRSR